MAFGAVSDVWFVILLTRAWGTVGQGNAVVDLPLAIVLLLGMTIAIGLFAYGASLNDVLDVRHDSAFSPDRPIPAGRIRVGQAMIVAVGALLISILAAQTLGMWPLKLTMLTAVAILFFNAAGRFIPAVGIVVIGLIHAIHMLIPNAHLTFTWPVWFVMTHAMGIAFTVHVLEAKRPRITKAALSVICVAWVFWSIVILGLGINRGGWWPEETTPVNILWPVLAFIAFIAVARWKTVTIKPSVAAEKLKRYGAMWQSLYGAMWLLALDLRIQAMWICLFALFGFTTMTIIKEMLGQMNRPLTYRE